MCLFIQTSNHIRRSILYFQFQFILGRSRKLHHKPTIDQSIIQFLSVTSLLTLSKIVTQLSTIVERVTIAKRVKAIELNCKPITLHHNCGVK